MSNRRQRASGELPDTIARIASEVDGMLAAADRALDANYPGERPGRQPVHTAYVAANAGSGGYDARQRELVDVN